MACQARLIVERDKIKVERDAALDVVRAFTKGMSNYLKGGSIDPLVNEIRKAAEALFPKHEGKVKE